MTREELNNLAKAYLFSGMPISLHDKGSQAVRAVTDGIKTILNIHMPEIKTAAKRYLDDDDQDAFFLALLPYRYKIWYEAYSPYWLLHCHLVTDHDSVTEFTYYNDLIDMYWAWEWQEWKKKEQYSVTIMLPPTRGLVSLQYADDMRALAEHHKKHHDTRNSMSFKQ